MGWLSFRRRRWFWTVLLLLAVSSTTVHRAVASARRKRRPHIVLFLADDLGYANVGYNAPDPKEPRTPFIDELAITGLRLENFYVYKNCAPTRASLLSGRLPIHVSQRSNPPTIPGAGIPPNLTTLADKLSSVGYRCHYVRTRTPVLDVYACKMPTNHCN